MISKSYHIYRSENKIRPGVPFSKEFVDEEGIESKQNSVVHCFGIPAIAEVFILYSLSCVETLNITRKQGVYWLNWFNETFETWRIVFMEKRQAINFPLFTTPSSHTYKTGCREYMNKLKSPFPNMQTCFYVCCTSSTVVHITMDKTNTWFLSLEFSSIKYILQAKAIFCHWNTKSIVTIFNWLYSGSMFPFSR